MSDDQIQHELQAYGDWRNQVVSALQDYRSWLDRYQLNSPHLDERIASLINNLAADRVTVAFAAEFSRGKTELINALFFAQTGVRLLPSSPGRTTMCPTEIFYDRVEGPFIRLLNIETRQESMPLGEFKQYPERWTHIRLDSSSVPQMQEAFKELSAVKEVSVAEATALGLYVDDAGTRNADDRVEIPCWRHALISFPHPLLQAGLSILDTPGLNALGSEPELTLSMLPSAQAIVFVLSADTGVTKSDMDMWQHHVHGYGAQPGKGIAVVMNKIDAMHDELQPDEHLIQAINSQAAKTAEVLGVPSKAIFPASAKQALIGKIKKDPSLLARSGVPALERYLADEVVGQRRTLMQKVVDEKIGTVVADSGRVLRARINELEKQLADLRKIDLSNQATIKKLMVETREQQGRYMTSVEDFQASRRVLSVQTRMLLDALSLERVDAVIRRTRREMANSLFTPGMKGAMKKVLGDLQSLVDRATSLAEESQELVRTIYDKFEEDHGFTATKPAHFGMRRYYLDLEQIFSEGEAFRQSTLSTVLEQSVVVNRLYDTVIARARDILLQANKEAANWGAMVLSPLVLQIKDHKHGIETRLEMLRKVSESTQTLDETIHEVQQQLEPLEQQHRELTAIIATLDVSAEPVVAAAA